MQPIPLPPAAHPPSGDTCRPPTLRGHPLAPAFPHLVKVELQLLGQHVLHRLLHLQGRGRGMGGGREDWGNEGERWTRPQGRGSGDAAGQEGLNGAAGVRHGDAAGQEGMNGAAGVRHGDAAGQEGMNGAAGAPAPAPGRRRALQRWRPPRAWMLREHLCGGGRGEGRGGMVLSKGSSPVRTV